MRSRLSITLAATAACALASVATAQFPTEIRSIDGTGNNLVNPGWGSAGVELVRAAPNDYADGVGSPSGGGRPGARAITNALCAEGAPKPNARGASDMLWQWGQFIDHDMDLTDAADPREPFSIVVPSGDPHFDPQATGAQTIGLSRSQYVMSGAPQVRQQINTITAFLDGSMVYGSDAARATELRRLDGTGRLKTSAGELLPFNSNAFPNAPTAHDPSLFLAGDVRANEQNGLTAMHTLFVREHNFWAGFFATMWPGASDETLYQAARAIVIAEIQHVTYDEWLPLLLGDGALRTYAGYDANVDPSIRNEFSTACFRFGHSMLSSRLERRDAGLAPIAAGHISLRDAFFNPSEIIAHGIEPLLRGLARQVAQDIDTVVVDDVRNFLFGQPGQGGFDLAALNIQRGRDHGLPSYNGLRIAYGLAPRASFAEITSDTAMQAQLAQAYVHVNAVDAWVGGLAEDHVPGALVGELVRAVLADQFARLRDGDRLWYEASLPSGMLLLVESQTLAEIIRRNSDVGSEIQDDVFVAVGNVVDLAGGCGGGGTLSPSGGDFVVGNPLFALRIDGAGLSASAAIMSFATGDDPTVYACGSCDLLLPTFVSAPFAVAAGHAILHCAVPSNSSFHGLQLHAQGMVITPGTAPCVPGADVSMTNRVALIVGD